MKSDPWIIITYASVKCNHIGWIGIKKKISSIKLSSFHISVAMLIRLKHFAQRWDFSTNTAYFGG